MEVFELMEMEEEVQELEEGSVPKRSFFGQLIGRSTNQEMLAADWVEMYENCRHSALVQLMQLVVHASGSQYKIPPDTMAPFNYTHILEMATMHFNGGGIYYPLTFLDGRITAAKLRSFVPSLVKALASNGNGLSDVFHVMKIFLPFVLLLSESEARPFRHTATLIGLQLMTGLLAVDAVKIQSLANIWMDMLNQLFEVRRMDVVDDIRCLCCKEFGLWLEKYPAEAFELTYSHVSCLFEALADTSPKVRKYCLEGILQMYSCDPRVHRACLPLVVMYQKSLLETALTHKEWRLRELAICLIISFLPDLPDLLSEEEIAMIESMMFDQNRRVAQAAAELFVEQHLSKEEDEHSRLHCVLKFCESFPEYEHAAYLVDALIEESNVVLAWAPMVGMLLAGPEQQREDPIIIEILTRAIKQSITAEIPPGRYTNHTVRGEPIAGAKETATQIMAPVMDMLLQKYDGNSANLKNLLEVPQYFDLDAEEHREHLALLIKRLQTIIFPQEDLAVMNMTAATLSRICVPPIRQDIQAILDTAVNNYRRALRDWYAALRVKANNMRRFNRLIETLQLVTVLHRHFDLTTYSDLWTSALKNLEQSVGGAAVAKMPFGTIHLYMEMCYNGLLWLQRLKEQDAAVNPSDDLKLRVTEVIRVAFKLVRTFPRKSFPFAVTTICDLYVLYGSLLSRPMIREFELLESHLMIHLFDTAPEQLQQEEAFEERQKKRRALTGYCKLVSFNIVPMMRFLFVLQHYVEFYDVFGDLIRSTLEKTLSRNATNYGMTLTHTCLELFERVLNRNERNGSNAAKSPEFADLLKLGKRLAETFNSSLLKSRPGVLALHRAGIHYASNNVGDRECLTGRPPETLPYLSILKAFVPQLLSQDKLAILKFLNERIPTELPSSRRVDWKPVEDYRTALELVVPLSRRRLFGENAESELLDSSDEEYEYMEQN